MDKLHHLTCSLYFGIGALEAFLNEKMRARMSSNKSEQEILDAIRKSTIAHKLTKWPMELLNAQMNVNQDTLDLIVFFNGIRGELTHPKSPGYKIYDKLELVSPLALRQSVEEYIARFHQAQGTRYPYWLFGWNYINPRAGFHEIVLLNDQQFLFSLQALGINVPAAAVANAEKWKDQYLGTFEGFIEVSRVLNTLDRCEPKAHLFPFKPILCRRWWAAEHHRSCGNVSTAPNQFARNNL